MGRQSYGSPMKCLGFVVVHHHHHHSISFVHVRAFSSLFLMLPHQSKSDGGCLVLLWRRSDPTFIFSERFEGGEENDREVTLLGDPSDFALERIIGTVAWRGPQASGMTHVPNTKQVGELHFHDDFCGMCMRRPESAESACNCVSFSPSFAIFEQISRRGLQMKRYAMAFYIIKSF